jgi:hypothetical protein
MRGKWKQGEKTPLFSKSYIVTDSLLTTNKSYHVLQLCVRVIYSNDLDFGVLQGSTEYETTDTGIREKVESN